MSSDKHTYQDFPAFPLNLLLQGVQVSSLVRELSPHGQKTKTYSGSNVLTNSVKTFKMERTKKRLYKEKTTYTPA